MNLNSSAISNKQTPRTQWHRILGTLLELLLTRLGIIVQTEVQVMSDPPKVDIVLLQREGECWSLEQSRLLCDGLRDTLASTLLIEFKYVESFNEAALLQALSYYFHYRQTQKLREDELQTFIMVAHTPRRAILETYGFAVSELPGVYSSQQVLAARVQLIVLNQLQLVQHNAFVQCFASRRRIYQSAFERIQQFDQEQLSESLWELVAGLHRKLDQKEGEMKKQPKQEELTAEKLIQIGKETRKFVLATSSPEDRLAGSAPEDRLAGLDAQEQQRLAAKMRPEDRLAGLAPEDRLAGLAPEELTKLMEQIEHFLSQQKSSDQ